IGVLMANYYHGDSLTYEDLAEKARVRGTATTRVRIRYQENTETGRPDVMSFATEGDNDQVRVRMGEKAPEYEAEEIRRSSQAYQSDGLPTPQSLASVYKFTLDDGHILYLGVGTDNKFVELTSSTHPDEFGGRGWHTGGDIEPVEVPSNTGNHNPYLPGRQDNPGGFQAHDDNGPVILTTPAPEDVDFNDYILITPVADIPAIYVYLSENAGDSKNKLLNPDWTNHGFKHFPQKNMTWNDIVKSTKSGPAKYIPGINIEEIERSAYKTGQPVTNGKTWKIEDVGRVIGASEGKESQWIRVEYSAGTIHGHPISLNEFRKLSK
ncbi:S-type pyocin domain-containing protein, partial [Morganella morganii]|uniref:S-type pyocin domain-containing protein n=1 Tax=Morganella morganii TaxID=582 RepID=UPI002367D7B4